MFIKETPEGLEIDVAGVMEAIDKRRSASSKKLKSVEETKVNFGSSEEDATFLLKAGELYFKLVAVQKASSVEDLLKEEYDKKLQSEIERIRGEFNKESSEFKLFAERSLKESEQEIQKLHKRLRNASPMPEITYEHAKAGLSVVKGTSGSLIWLFRTVYAPQFYDEHMLNSSIIKKMTTPMIIMITTKDEEVLNVETRTISLDFFRHYHRHGSDSRRMQPGGDCWGQWKWAGKRVKGPDEVLALAREASNVLTKVNSHSPACRQPTGLPRLSTLEQNIVKRGETPTEVEYSTPQVRAGLDSIIATSGGWNTRTTTR